MGKKSRKISIAESVQAALQHHQSGRLPQAEAIYRRVLQAEPNHSDVLHWLGLLTHQAGGSDKAIELINHAIRSNRANPNLHNNLGTVYSALNRRDEAAACYQKAVELRPQFAEAHSNLAATRADQGRLSEAEASSRRALEIKPDYAEAHSNLGNALKGQGRLREAEASYRRALEIKADYAEAHSNLGSVLLDQGRLSEAEASCRRAAEIRPDFAEAHSNLGNVLRDQGRLSEAEAGCRRAVEIRPDFAEAHSNLGNTLLDQGRLSEAEASYRRALEIKPDYAEAHSNLGNVLLVQGRLSEAEASCRRAVEIRPDYADAHSNLGNALKGQGRLDDAEASFRRAVEIKPDYAEAHSNLGNALLDQGRVSEAEASYRRALEIKPDYAEAHSNLLFALNYHPDSRAGQILGLCQEYDLRFGLPHGKGWREHGNGREANRRLRVGYVSPDFRRHAVAYFIEPVLANHDKNQVEVFCYYNHTQRDDFTERIATYADHWLSCKAIKDEQLAERIRADGIDILVDLAGHTAQNRMPVFARKPAPVQVTYLGYPGSSGLSAMDYRLTDACADPEGSEANYSETLLRLPDSLWCYRPTADMPEIVPLPALQNGYVTFGSFNNFNKLSDPCIELWAELLRAVPSARLLMVTVPEGGARQRLAQQFGTLGVAPERLEFHGRLSGENFHRMLQRADMTLDPIFVNGATTTCESLWLGVPVISMSGARFLSRAGSSITNAAGLHEFTAGTPEDYVRIAVHLARNVPLLAEFRAGLRVHVAASALVDETRFTRNLERIYRDIWIKWCSRAA